jgi:hypothetical protein
MAMQWWPVVFALLLVVAFMPRSDGTGSASEAEVLVSDATSLLAALNDSTTTTVRIVSSVIALDPISVPLVVTRSVKLVGPIGGSISAVLNFQQVAKPLIIIQGNGHLALSSLIIVNGSAGEHIAC